MIERPAPMAVTELLLQGEGPNLDYKRSLDGVGHEDFCAFANQSGGGTLLIGVTESRNELGIQIGVPTGCPIDDGAKLFLVNKAQSCHPPVYIEVYIETENDISFLRVEIPPSETRPHCTPKGTYLSRSDARNVALLPTELLNIFLERESAVFQRRFSEVSSSIIDQISQTESQIKTMQESIEERVESISDQLGWSDFNLDDTGDKIDRVEALVRETLKREIDTASRLREIMRSMDADDPIKKRALKAAKEAIKRSLLENEELLKGATTGDKLELRTSGEIAEELNGEELQKVFDEVVEETLFAKK